MNKALEILKERLASIKEEKAVLECRILKGDDKANIRSFEHALAKYNIWIAEIERAIEILNA